MPPTSRLADRIARRVLLAPDVVARTAAAGARTPEERWMLSQPRAVRASYVREVLDAGAAALRTEIWMLRQPDPVRESYVRSVLEPRL